MGKNNGKNNAKMVDVALFLAAGYDPKTGLPLKCINLENPKGEFKKIFRIMDEQDAVNRYKWSNVPCNLSSQEIERLIYYKGQLCFFYFEELDQFFFMPFALDGTLDFYARYNKIHPVPIVGSGQNATRAEKETYDKQAALLANKHLTVVKAPKLVPELTLDALKNSAVILWDYTKQIGENIIPRAQLQEPILESMAEIPCYLRTLLMKLSGIEGMRVADADAAKETAIASKQIKEAALKSEGAVPITSAVEFQELFSSKNGGTVQDFTLALQALENLRLSTYGLDNGGLYEKKAHKLEGEQEMNSSTVGLINDDGLAWRQHFCNIVNSIWGLSMWCEPAESVLGDDIDGDGLAYDDDVEGQQSGVTTPEGGKE